MKTEEQKNGGGLGTRLMVWFGQTGLSASVNGAIVTNVTILCGPVVRLYWYLKSPTFFSSLLMNKENQ